LLLESLFPSLLSTIAFRPWRGEDFARRLRAAMKK